MKKANKDKPNEQTKPNKVKADHLEFNPDRQGTKNENKKGVDETKVNDDYSRRFKR